MLNFSVHQLSQALQKKIISSKELLALFLQQIKQVDPYINAFITVDEESALLAAEHADQMISQGCATPLTGIPIGHKDNLCIKGMRATCASHMLEDFTPLYDSFLVKRLKDAGVICVGKLNMDEFGMGSTGATSFFGETTNPWGENYFPGGSSSGSAAAVAARLVPLATGSDTGGSIRQPAAWCGVTGLKPTYGRVSRYGLIAFSPVLDQVGPIGKSAKDCGYMLSAMAGFDQRDANSSQQLPENFCRLMSALPQALTNQPLANLRFAVVPQLFYAVVGKQTDVLSDALEILQKLGAGLHDVHLSHLSLYLPLYYVLSSMEISSSLSRFTGIHFGHRAKDFNDWVDLCDQSRGEGFGLEAKKRIIFGTHLLHQGYSAHLYRRSRHLCQKIRTELLNILLSADIIVTPVTSIPAYHKGDIIDALEMRRCDEMTVLANLSGLPSISLPCGFNEIGMPVGLQLIARPFDEAFLLAVADAFQEETNFHQKQAHISSCSSKMC